jgi:hypothetical protein
MFFQRRKRIFGRRFRTVDSNQEKLRGSLTKLPHEGVSSNRSCWSGFVRRWLCRGGARWRCHWRGQPRGGTIASLGESSPEFIIIATPATIWSVNGTNRKRSSTQTHLSRRWRRRRFREDVRLEEAAVLLGFGIIEFEQGLRCVNWSRKWKGWLGYNLNRLGKPIGEESLGLRDLAQLRPSSTPAWSRREEGDALTRGPGPAHARERWRGNGLLGQPGRPKGKERGAGGSRPRGLLGHQA